MMRLQPSVAKELKRSWSTLLLISAMIDASKGGRSMTLGENISALRNQHEMSQGNLAEKLNVSRQSISKWETDTSIPELDKLIQLSEIFDITLDELVKRDAPPTREENENANPENIAPGQPVQVIVQKSASTQKIVGVILLCFGAAVLLILTLLGGILSGLLFSSPFILCGIICLTFKRNVGLWCAWALLFAVNVYLRYATSISWRLTLWTLNYEPSMNYIRLVFAWIELICYVLIVVVTVLHFRKKPLVPTKKTYTLLAVGCVALALTYIPVTMDTLGYYSTVTRIYFLLCDWVRLALLTPTLTTAARLIYGRKSKIAAE